MESLQTNRPHLLIITGIPGSGKSTFSAKFSETFGAPIVSDQPVRQIDADASTELRHAVVDYQLQQLLLTGATIIVDNHSANRKQRQEIIKLARQRNYQPLVVWVQIDEPSAKKRASSLKYSPEQFTTGLKNFVEPSKSEPVVVISGKHNYAAQAKVVLAKLANQRQPEPKPKLRTPKRRGNLSVR